MESEKYLGLKWSESALSREALAYPFGHSGQGFYAVTLQIMRGTLHL
jgi:hypothetical protein